MKPRDNTALIAKLVLGSAMLWGGLTVGGFMVHWGLGLIFVAIAAAVIVWL